MSGPFIVVGRSRLKPGKADAYAAWRTEMFRDVEEQEPRLLAFNEWDSNRTSSGHSRPLAQPLGSRLRDMPRPTC